MTRLNVSLLSLVFSVSLFVGCGGTREAREAQGSRVTPLGTSPSGTERAVEPRITEKPAEESAEPTPSETETAKTEPASKQETTPTKPPSKAQPQLTRYVDATTLNVRAEASTEASVQNRLPRNARVSVINEKSADGRKWAQIRYYADNRARTGWVATNYLSATKSSAPVVSTQSASAPSRPRTLKKTKFHKPEGEYFEQFERLNYTSIPKPSLPGNPKIDAKGVYVSFAVLKSDRFDEILKLIETTELNALVIDFKDDIGGLLQKSPTASVLVPEAHKKAVYDDATDLVKRLKAKGIYLIARIVTFKDPMFAKAHPEVAIIDRSNGKPYKSGDGLAWASPYAKKFRQYNIGIAREAAKAGFNEIQFDYVRFPDVPRSANLNYRNQTGVIKAEAIQSFLLEARTALKPYNVYTAADVFGWITTTVDDLRIGQYWEAMSNAVDYVCPMMYPSHYSKGNYNLDNPNAQPYETIKAGLTDATLRDKALNPPAEIRPWLQGFGSGGISYGPSKVKAQIRAAKEFGINSYLIWNAQGKYDAAAYR